MQISLLYKHTFTQTLSSTRQSIPSIHLRIHPYTHTHFLPLPPAPNLLVPYPLPHSYPYHHSPCQKHNAVEPARIAAGVGSRYTSSHFLDSPYRDAYHSSFSAKWITHGKTWWKSSNRRRNWRKLASLAKYFPPRLPLLPHKILPSQYPLSFQRYSCLCDAHWTYHTTYL